MYYNKFILRIGGFMDIYEKALDRFIDYINYKIKREDQMSVRKLAKIFNMNNSTLQGYLNKERNIDILTAFKLAKYYDISIDSFLYNDIEVSSDEHDIDHITISISAKAGSNDKNRKLISFLDQIKDTME